MRQLLGYIIVAALGVGLVFVIRRLTRAPSPNASPAGPNRDAIRGALSDNTLGRP
jgi:hypothetical protein